MSLNKEALLYHSQGKKGKIEVIPTKPHGTQRDLSLAYSPGVAAPCKRIEENPDEVYEYTSKGNLVAVISNGTAVLGLGDIGPEASKPVMEGKSLLFKIFANIDSFDIEVDTKDVDEFVRTVKLIAPTFGGINLEDIKAPEAFEIERRLQEELSIPVMHDDQHGTAIISTAALINAIEIAQKKIEDISIVINGAGASAISCSRLYKMVGVKKENIIMLDSKGAITTKRTDLSPQKQEFAIDTDITTLDEAIQDADVFVGLSKGNILSTTMLSGMAKNPIVFALANPTPEIDYELAISTRTDVIMATGRSDNPNQVNNVLGFPFIFRGALDVRATEVNMDMKLAAVYALASLAKRPVPEKVKEAYNLLSMEFGKDYIIPKPFDPRLITEVSYAVAKAAVDSGVAKAPITDWEGYKQSLLSRQAQPRLTRMIGNLARKDPKRIVFPEGYTPAVIKSAYILGEEDIAYPILLGQKSRIEKIMEEHQIPHSDQVTIYDVNKEQEDVERYAKAFWTKNQRRGVKYEEALTKMKHKDTLAGMMVDSGDADAVITGTTKSYKEAFHALNITIGVAPEEPFAVSLTAFVTKTGTYFLSDVSLNPDPTAEQMCEMAQMSARLVERLGIEPRIAMLSHSNYGTSTLPSARKVKKAASLFNEKYGDQYVLDGELSADVALNAETIEHDYSFSKLMGGSANVFIFPNIDSANITYKMLRELLQPVIIGPILMGMNKSAHILPITKKTDEILHLSAYAVIDAQHKANTR